MVKLCPPQIAATTFAFSSVFILLLHMLWLQEIRMSDRLVIDHPPPHIRPYPEVCCAPPTHSYNLQQSIIASSCGGGGGKSRVYYAGDGRVFMVAWQLADRLVTTINVSKDTHI